VYNEDVMEAVLDTLRFQLTYNIYPFHDPRLCSAARPQLAQAAAAAAEAAASAAKRKLSAKKAKAAAVAGIG
jgi:cohesin loading factor subunit SCC2